MRSWHMPAAFALLTLLLFGDCLVVPGRLPAYIATDIRSQYLNWRTFAAGQIHQGHFPLWNPYAFCGTPFFADPQSAMLFPPNWVYLILSPERASSVLFAAHFFLAAWFTGLWVRRRGGSILAGIGAGTIYACSGPVIANIAAGHLPLLCSAAWTPLLLLCVEAIFNPDPGRRGDRARFALIGIGVVALLALDGYPQFAYYTALTAGLYGLLLLRAAPERWRSAAAVAVMFVGGWSIAAAQIFASAQFTTESVRAGGLSYASAAAFSLPPEDLLGLAIPGLLGDGIGLPYYGRSSWCEICLFVGPVTLLLAALAMRERRHRKMGLLTLAMIVLALGVYTPLYPVLFRWLPGFAEFRATGRFGLLADLFLAILAAHGWDRLRVTPAPRRVPAALAALGLLLGGAAVWAWRAEIGSPGVFTRLLLAIKSTGQSPELQWIIHPDFPAQAASFAAQELTETALIVLLAAGFLAIAGRRPVASRAALAVLALADITWFAVSFRARSDSFPPPRRGWMSAIAAVKPPSRVLVTGSWFAESGPRFGFLNVAGHNPMLLSRTNGYLAAAEMQSPEWVGLMDPRHINDRLCRMLRGALVVPNWPLGIPYKLADPLPRMVLLDRCTVAADADAALAAVLDEQFDPAKTAVLETAFSPSPGTPGEGRGEGEGLGQARILRETTDELEIEADVPAPRLLLITDAYSSGWHATPLDAGDTRTYSVLPADYCLRGIPLAAGHHHFLLRYRPGAVIAGAWISAAALLIYLGAIGGLYFHFRISKETA